MNNNHSQVLLVFRKNPGKWNYMWSSVIKTWTALTVGILKRFCCFDEVFLMALTSTEQLFIETPLYRRFCIMITYTISSNLFKKGSLQCYRLNNFQSFRNGHWRCSVRKGVLGNFEKSTGKHLWQSLFFNKVAGWGDCFWSFSCLLLLKISFLFHFNRKMKWKREIPWRSWNIYFFARVSICLTSKISKEIWQMVIWSEDVFKENLMLQFSWLEEFR